MFKGILMCVRSLVTIGRIFRAQWAAQKVTKKWKNMFDNFVPGVWMGALKSITNSSLNVTRLLRHIHIYSYIF